MGIGTGAIVATAGLASDRFVWLAVAWFAAVTVPVFLFASISGAHLNPLVSAVLVADRRIPASEAMPHVGAQLVGAFAGSGAVLLVFGGSHGLGATVPVPTAIGVALAGEFVFTFALLASVLALVRVGPGRGRWRLLWPGIVVGISTYVIGPWSGSSLNPARTIAPAVLSLTFSGIWIYFVAPPAAAVVAILAVRARGAPVLRAPDK